MRVSWVSFSCMSNMKKKMAKDWREAATLILTSKCDNAITSTTRFTEDYNVVLLKRSAKSKFFPNTYVFPGGGFDEGDKSPGWLEVFQAADADYNSAFDQLKVDQCSSTRSPMMLPDEEQTTSSHHPRLPLEIAYRICAIRETFEETGILLARSANSGKLCRSNNKLAGVYRFDSAESAEYWRGKVYENAFNFIHLCRKLECVPDVFALHEWSNWLTPVCAGMRPSKRYDTIFYQAAVARLPTFVRHDNRETTELVVQPPEFFLEKFFLRKCVLGPPQIYELSRLIHHARHEQLIRFFVQRGRKGIERYLPILATCTDGAVVALYPGDQDYPHGYHQTSETEPIGLNISSSQLFREQDTSCFNRSVRWMGRPYDFVSLCTSVPSLGHLHPVDLCRSLINSDPKL